MEIGTCPDEPSDQLLAQIAGTEREMEASQPKTLQYAELKAKRWQLLYWFMAGQLRLEMQRRLDTLKELEAVRRQKIEKEHAATALAVAQHHMQKADAEVTKAKAFATGMLHAGNYWEGKAKMEAAKVEMANRQNLDLRDRVVKLEAEGVWLGKRQVQRVIVPVRMRTKGQPRACGLREPVDVPSDGELDSVAEAICEP